MLAASDGFRFWEAGKSKCAVALDTAFLLRGTEPTHEARAEAKLAWALPCEKEEDEVKALLRA